MTSHNAQSADVAALPLAPRPLGDAAASGRATHVVVAPTPARLAAIAVGAAVAAGIAATVTVNSAVLAAPVANGACRAAAIVCWVGVGLVTWKRRPRDRLGVLFVLAGFAYAATTLLALSNPALFTLGRVGWALLVVLLVYVLLVFPHGALERGPATWIFRAAAYGTVLLWTPLLLGGRELPIGAVLTRCSGRCPQNPFRVADLGIATTGVVSRTVALFTTAILIAVAAVVLQRMLAGGGPSHRMLLPAFACLVTWSLAVGVSNTMRVTQGEVQPALAIGWLGVIAALCVPWALLLGQLRGRLFARAALYGALRELARHDGRRDVRAVLADALGDPSLELLWWSPALGRYVDARGQPVAPEESDTRSVTEIRSGSERVAIAHSHALDEMPGIMEAAGAGAALALENAGLEAKLRASNEELRASRARLFAAGAEERRRIERDLHDGAQNRLVALRIELGLAADRAADVAAGELERRLLELADDAQEALDGVRAIAHGVYPPLLASRGLGDALAAEADRTAAPARFAGDDAGRSTPEVEAAVYFCCLEAMQNTCKHARAGARITIRLRREGERLAFAVQDDGAGFDARTCRSAAGLTNVHDRISAVGGDVEVVSAPGRGTTVRGAVPWPAR